MSKIFWLVFAPSHVIVWLSVAAAIALILGKRRAGLGLVIVTAVMLIGAGVVPSATWLLRPLEFQYGRPLKLPDNVKGIVILGGGESNNARLLSGFALALRYPAAVVIYTGGSNKLIGEQDDIGARRAKAVLLNLGLEPERLIVESRSRNTWENILFSRELVKPEPGQTWLLATSAIQMPRAMGVARELDWNFVAWPTDWHTGQHVFSGYFLIPLNLGLFDEAVREWIGLFAYRLTGRAR